MKTKERLVMLFYDISFNMIKIILFFQISITVAFSQNNFSTPIVSSVDTTNKEISEVVKLWNHYFNFLTQQKDKIKQLPQLYYPYWDTDNPLELTDSSLYFYDMAFVFFRSTTPAYLKQNYPPKILSVENVSSIDTSYDKIYRIRILFNSNKWALDSTYSKWTPRYILQYYAIKKNDHFYLKNTIDFAMRKWKKITIGSIHFFIHPTLQPNKKEMQVASNFYEQIFTRVHKQQPNTIQYFVCPSQKEVGELLNAEYWLSFTKGFTQVGFNRIVTVNNFCHKHELSHLIFNKQYSKFKNMQYFPLIEGIATFYGGTNGKQSFDEQWKEIINTIPDTLTLDDILLQRYRNKFSNDVLYITTAFIIKEIYDKKGDVGITLFLDTKNYSEFKKQVSDFFQMPYEKFNLWIIKEMKRKASL